LLSPSYKQFVMHRVLELIASVAFCAAPGACGKRSPRAARRGRGWRGRWVHPKLTVSAEANPVRLGFPIPLMTQFVLKV